MHWAPPAWYGLWTSVTGACNKLAPLGGGGHHPPPPGPPPEVIGPIFYLDPRPMKLFLWRFLWRQLV